MKALISLLTIEGGGWHTYCEKLSMLLISHGYEVDYIVDRGNNKFNLIYGNAAAVFFVLNRALESRDKVINRVSKKISGNGRYDLGINISSEYGNDIFGKLNIPKIITTIHSIKPREIRNAIQSNYGVHEILAVSENVRNAAVHDMRLNKSDIRVLPPITLNQCSTEIKTNDGDINLLYLGRVTKEAKRADKIPNLVRRLSSLGLKANFHIVGDGDYLPIIQKSLLEMPMTVTMVYHGWKKSEEVNQILSKSHILILMSSYEGCPHSVLEAMAFGVVPVVTEIIGSTSNIIQNNEDGILIRDGDVDEFANTIFMLAKNPNRLNLMSNLGKLKFSKDYSEEKITAEWIKIISKNSSKAIIVKRAFKITDFIIGRAAWLMVSRFLKALRVL